MNKDELTAYVYNNMSIYTPLNVARATKSAEAFWRVYATRLELNDEDVLPILDSFIESTFKSNTP